MVSCVINTADILVCLLGEGWLPPAGRPTPSIKPGKIGRLTFRCADLTKKSLMALKTSVERQFKMEPEIRTPDPLQPAVGLSSNQLLQLDFYTPFPTNVRQLVRQALPPVRLMRVAPSEVSSKLRIQLRLHNHCSQGIQCPNSCAELPILLSLGGQPLILRR